VVRVEGEKYDGFSFFNGVLSFIGDSIGGI
jgi:hypothetical protein